MSSEQEQQRTPSPEAEKIRSDAQALKAVLLADVKAASKPLDLAKVSVAAVIHCFFWIPEIAAQLAEMNSRDRESEIRAKQAEQFVMGIQAELQRQHILMPQGTFIPGQKK